MIRNFLKIAYRNLLKNKGFSLINISGLAIGMASSILILLWIQNELSYDRFHVKGNRLFEVWSVDTKAVDGVYRAYSVTPEIMAPSLKQDYPDLEEVCRLSWNEPHLFAIGDKNIRANGMIVDHGFLNMFTFPLLYGNPGTALKDPQSLVVTRKMAIKLFGKEDVIGKTVKVDNDENFTISAVAMDLPNNTQFDFEFLFSLAEFGESARVKCCVGL